MNGRIYDPIIGRFISADPFVDSAGDSQSFNRYSYVNNNPIGYTDPSGYLKVWKDILGPIVQYVAAHFGMIPAAIVGATINGTKGAIQGAAGSLGMTIGYFIGGPVGAKIGYGFASGFSNSLLNGGSIGDAFKSGVIGGAQAYVAHHIGQQFNGMYGPGEELYSNFWIEAGRAAAHGALGGAVEEARGGEFRHGFNAAFAGSVAGSITGGGPLGSMGGVEGFILRTTIAATIGGTAAEMGGGKFANGAQTAAFQHMFNHEGAAIMRLGARLAVSGAVATQLDSPLPGPGDVVGAGLIVAGGGLVVSGAAWGAGENFGAWLSDRIYGTQDSWRMKTDLGIPGKDLPGKGDRWTKLKGDQGWRDADGNIWKKDKLHKDHWDISDRKGNKVREVDFGGRQIWPNGPKNKNK